MKKIIFIICSLFVFVTTTSAVTNIDYEIEDYIVDASIDGSGNILVKEILAVEGSYNGYIRDLVYKNDELNEFKNDLDSFKGSSIYNGNNIILNKVGSIDWTGELKFDAFNNEVDEFSECNNPKKCYEKSNITNGISIKMYNETQRDITYFYIEYMVSNVVVMHNDVAEIYYNFIGNNFDDDIEKYQLRVVLPMTTTEQIRAWAHGPLTGEISLISKDKTFYGSYLKINNLDKNTPIDLRMTFPKNLIFVDHPYLKKSNVDALDKILTVEQERADSANKIRRQSKIIIYGVYGLASAHIIITILVLIYVYLKYDKEIKSEFNNEYNREFIDDYDVTNIQYLMEKSITEKAFSTSILNLIYKKNISFEKIDNKNYKFTLENQDNLNAAEQKLVDLIFKEAGNGLTVELNQIKNYASGTVGTTSPFLNGFTAWQNTVLSEAQSQGFYEKNTKIKIYLGLYSILGFIMMSIYYKYPINILVSGTSIILTFVLIVYTLAFTKKTPKGALHHAKWKAFKKFLEDFGRFNEKDLPEITLWERYLVYANIFGIADKLGKTMKIKFHELGTSYTNKDFIFDYMLYTDLNYNVSKTVNRSVSTARTKVSEAVARSSSSSGSGFGGGFSSGGGFGGGGGGGRGF